MSRGPTSSVASREWCSATGVEALVEIRRCPPKPVAQAQPESLSQVSDPPIGRMLKT